MKDSSYLFEHLSLNALMLVLVSNNAVQARKRYAITPNVIITTLQQDFIPCIFQEGSKASILLKLTQDTRETQLLCFFVPLMDITVFY